MTTPDLHMTIAAAVGRTPDLRHELRLLKAGMLYADRVTFYSLASQMILSVLALGQLQGKGRVELLRELMPHMPNVGKAEINALDRLSQLSKKKRRTTEELLPLRAFEASMAPSWAELQRQTETIAVEAGVQGLLEALQNNTVVMGVLPDEAPDGVDATDYMLQAYVGRIDEALVSPQTYPLFDEATAGLAAARIREGLVSPSEAATVRGKQAGIANYLFDRLPSLERLSIQRILDLRDELKTPLHRFRGAVVAHSAGVASSPWDGAFGFEAEQLMRRELDPALADLEDAIKSNSLVRRATKELTSFEIAGGSAIGLALAAFADLSPAIAAGVAGAATVGGAVSRAWAAHQDEQNATRQHMLYFYYRVSRE